MHCVPLQNCYYRQVGGVGRVFSRAIPASRCNTPEDWMERSPMAPCGASREPPCVATAQATRRQSHGSFSRCALIADDACDACPPPARDDDRRALLLLAAGERLRPVWLIMSATRGEKEPGNQHSHAGPSTRLPGSLLSLRHSMYCVANLLVTPSTFTMDPSRLFAAGERRKLR